jgi:hypothetical protein
MRTTKTRIRVYDSVEEMTEACDRAFRRGRMVNGTDSAFARSTFIGRAFSGWVEAQAAANQTWVEGVQLLEELSDLISATVQTQPRCRKRRTAWSEDGGDEIDIDRVRSGQAPWRTCQRQQVTGQQTVTIVANMATSCNRGAEEIMWRGAAAVVLAKILEDAGYRVEIHVANTVMRAFKCGDHFSVYCRAKRADQPLDIATLANTVSGWFFRTVVFQSYHAEEIIPRRDLGAPRQLTAEDVEEGLPQAQEPIIIDGLWSMSEAALFVNQVLERFAS